MIWHFSAWAFRLPPFTSFGVSTTPDFSIVRGVEFSCVLQPLVTICTYLLLLNLTGVVVKMITVPCAVLGGFITVPSRARWTDKGTTWKEITDVYFSAGGVEEKVVWELNKNVVWNSQRIFAAFWFLILWFCSYAINRGTSKVQRF